MRNSLRMRWSVLLITPVFTFMRLSSCTEVTTFSYMKYQIEGVVTDSRITNHQRVYSLLASWTDAATSEQSCPENWSHLKVSYEGSFIRGSQFNLTTRACSRTYRSFLDDLSPPLVTPATISRFLLLYLLKCYLSVSSQPKFLNIAT